MFISPQRRRRRQQSLLSPDISPQPSPLARAAVAASKARSALAPTQTSNDDAASVDKRQPDAFKAFLDVAADLPEAAPPVSKPQTRGELKRFQRARLAWEAARPEREAARLRREEIKRETEAVARKLVEARKELERTIAETPEPPPSVDEVYAQVQARRQAAEAAVEASSPPSKLPFGSPAPAPAPKPAAFGFGSPAAAPAPAAAKSSYPPMPSKPPSKLPFGSPAAAKTASSGYPPMPSKAPSKLPFGAPAPAPAAKPATFGFGSPAAAPAPAAAKSSYPPMPTKAPSKLPFGAPAPAPVAKPAGFGSPAPAAPTTQEELPEGWSMQVPKDAEEAEKWRVCLEMEQAMRKMRKELQIAKAAIAPQLKKGQEDLRKERALLAEARTTALALEAQEREFGEARAALLGSVETAQRQNEETRANLDIAEGMMADCTDATLKQKRRSGRRSSSTRSWTRPVKGS